MKKIIPILIAVVLIVIIGAGTVAGMLYEKYSYSKERADLTSYFQVQGEEKAIILQDEMIAEKAIMKNGRCYLHMDTVTTYFNEIFYVDLSEQILLYTTATELIRTDFGSSIMRVNGAETDLGYEIVYSENDVIYIALDYVKLYTNLSYEIFDQHMQIYNTWGSRTVATLKKDTAVRLRGGVKSEILKDLAKGDQVEIL